MTYRRVDGALVRVGADAAWCDLVDVSVARNLTISGTGAQVLFRADGDPRAA